MKLHPSEKLTHYIYNATNNNSYQEEELHKIIRYYSRFINISCQDDCDRVQKYYLLNF